MSLKWVEVCSLPKMICFNNSPLYLSIHLIWKEDLGRCNQMKMRYIRLGCTLNPMTSLFIRESRGRFWYRDTERDTRKKALWQWILGWGWCSHKPRITKDHQPPPEARWEAWNRFSLKASRKSQHCHQHFGFGLLAPRTVTERNFCYCKPPSLHHHMVLAWDFLWGY